MMPKRKSSKWDDYYRAGKDFSLISSHMLDAILSLAGMQVAGNVLDIGCGTGQLTRELYHRGYRCTGIDVSEEAIKKAQYQNEAIQYAVLDIEAETSKELPSQSFSLIICKFVFPFIENKFHFLQKMNMLLKPGGAAVIIVPLLSDVPDKPHIAVDYHEMINSLSEHFGIVKSLRGKRSTSFICLN